MNLETLNLLQDNGRGCTEPLRITTQENADGILVERNGRRARLESLSRDPLRQLEWSLRHHPQEVTINGRTIRTTPWPGTAGARISEPDNGEDEPRTGAPIPNGAEQDMLRGFNAISGGVMFRAQIGYQASRMMHLEYFTPAPGQSRPYHQPLALVTLGAFAEIRASELGQLHQTRTGIAVVDSGNLEREIVRRGLEMLRRTVSNPAMPEPYAGRVYPRPLTGPQGSDYFNEPYPIGVSGTPVIIDQQDSNMTNARFVTIVENLHRANSRLVPVGEDGAHHRTAWIPAPGKSAARVRNTSFLTRTCGPGQASRITMKMELDDGSAVTQECCFRLEGEDEQNAHAWVIRDRTNREELAKFLFQAYWLKREWKSGEEIVKARDDLARRMDSLALHLTGKTREAVRDQLQRTVDQILLPMPRPGGRMTVVNQDGSIQITLNPQEENG